MGAFAIPKVSPEEYLEIDRRAELKSEYHDGEMFPIEASSLRHARIVPKLAGALDSRLIGGPCDLVAATPLRVRVSPTKYLYPDVVVVCGEPKLTDEVTDTLINPKVIAEVLSPSTSDYDHGRKFALYRMLPSLAEYLLVEQDEPRVEIFRKESDTIWQMETVEGLDQSVSIRSLGIDLPLSEIYARVTFD